MEAPNFRQQTSKQAYCLIMASIAMLALPTISIAKERHDSSSRIAQYTQEGTAKNSNNIEKSLMAPAPLHSLQGNNAVITQTGDNNEASIEQHSYGDFSSGNMAWIYQNGYNNSADVYQRGKKHAGIVYQQGRNLTASINQVGNGYRAAIYQTGPNADATIHQAGSSGQGISIKQFSRSGTGMNVIITTH